VEALSFLSHMPTPYSLKVCEIAAAFVPRTARRPRLGPWHGWVWNALIHKFYREGLSISSRPSAARPATATSPRGGLPRLRLSLPLEDMADLEHSIRNWARDSNYANLTEEQSKKIPAKSSIRQYCLQRMCNHLFQPQGPCGAARPLSRLCRSHW
jgi:hypothetical protein